MKQLPRGVLVTIEGMPGSGTAALAADLSFFLQKAGFDVLHTREPSEGRWGSMVRPPRGEGRLGPAEELAMEVADRKEHVAEVVEPALKKGRLVVVEGYVLTTVAEAAARGLSAKEALRENEAFAPAPDLALWLDVDPAVAHARLADDPDRDPSLDLDALAARQRAFAALDRRYVRRIDADRDAAERFWRAKVATYQGPLFDRLCGREMARDCSPRRCSLADSSRCDYFACALTLLSPPRGLP